MRVAIVLSSCLAALTLASGASAGLAIFDLRTDLAAASRNTFGDVRVAPRALLVERAPGATLVRCAGICTYGRGWLAFARGPALAHRDVARARARRVRGATWAISLDLTAGGAARWAAFARRAAKAAATRGVADALVLAVDGSVAGQPLADQIVRKGARLEITGLSRANALRAAKALQ